MTRRLWLKDGFISNILTLMTGTTIAQAVPILISPILTRIYTPRDFGILALFTAIVSIVGTIAAGRYEMAVMLPRKKSDAANVVVLAIKVSLIVSLVMFGVVCLFNESITQLLRNPEMSIWLYIAPISVFLTGVYQCFTYWNNRENNYKSLAINSILKSSSTATVNLTAGWIGVRSGGLVLGGIIGQFISVFALARNLSGEDKGIFYKTRFAKQVALGKKYKNFPLINAPHAFLNAMTGGVSLLVISNMYGPLSLGHFSLVEKVIFTPIALVSTSLTQVYYSNSAEYYRNNKSYSNQTKKIIAVLFLIGLIPFCIFNFFADSIFTTVFGSEWVEAGRLAQVYSIYALFHFIASPLSVIPLVCNKEAEAFSWNLTGSLLYSGAIVTGALLKLPLSNALLYLSITMSIYFSAFAWRVIKMTSWEKEYKL